MKCKRDINSNHFGMKFIRFNMEVDITKPIPNGFFHKTDKGGRWTQFTYERMADICYKCGRLGHFMHHCKYELAYSQFLPNEEGTSLYGP